MAWSKPKLMNRDLKRLRIDILFPEDNPVPGNGREYIKTPYVKELLIIEDKENLIV